MTPTTIALMKTIYNSDIEALHELVRTTPEVFARAKEERKYIVSYAAKKSTPEFVRALIACGADPDEVDSNQFSALAWTVSKARLEMLKTLLESGANPNAGCPMFNVASQDIDDRIAYAKALIDGGADVNQLFVVEDLPDRTVLSEAEARGHAELAAYLRSRSAKLPDEVKAESTFAKRGRPQGASMENDILSHIQRHYGTPSGRPGTYTIPNTPYSVAVRFVPASESKSKCGVLFTTGLSECPLQVPAGSEQYQRAELMLSLPAKWPAPEVAMKSPKTAWPIQWLLKIATYPVANNTWLGGPWTCLTEYEPPQPLGPGTKLAAWLLAAPEMDNMVVRCANGQTVQFYKLYPIYPEEYAFERQCGVQAFMSRISTGGFPDYVDVKRKNFCK